MSAGVTSHALQLADEVRHLTAVIPREESKGGAIRWQGPPLTPTQIRKMTAAVEEAIESSGFSLADLRARSRLAPVVRVRHRAMGVLRVMGFTTYAIGEFLHRDRTAVSHGLRSHEEMRR